MEPLITLKNIKIFNKVIAESDRGIYYAMNKGIKVAKS